jgi:hypothetical protein
MRIYKIAQALPEDKIRFVNLDSHPKAPWGAEKIQTVLLNGVEIGTIWNNTTRQTHHSGYGNMANGFSYTSRWGGISANGVPVSGMMLNGPRKEVVEDLIRVQKGTGQTA